MVPTTMQRLAAAADLLRPRTLFRTLARVDQLVRATREMEATLEALQIRTQQLESITRLDWELQGDIARLPEVLEPGRIRLHVDRAVAAATLEHDPCPYIVIDEWLPPDVYATMRRGVPPAVFFANREESRQRMTVPFSYAPLYSRLVWQFVTDHIVGSILADALNRKFSDVVRDYVRDLCGTAAENINLTLRPSDGRIMLRRPGYVIPPHRDPRWGFLTGLIYLARDNDDEAHGTKLYRVNGDEDAPNDKPFYVDEARCELVRAVPFRPNTLLVFLNSRGAHGASIPADAQPKGLERYVYQFRLGPDTPTIRQLLACMPPESRVRWAGGKSQKAAPVN